MISPDPILLVLVAVAIIFLMGMVRRPFYGVIGYMIIMVMRPGLYYPVLGAMRLELVAGLIVIAAMFLSKGKLQRIAPANSQINKYSLILYGVMAVSMLQAFDFSHSKEWMIEFAKICVFFMMIVTLTESEKDVKTLLWVFGILMSFLAYQAIYNYHAGVIVESWGGDRIDYSHTGKGLGAGHVALSNLTLQGLPFVWFFTWQSRKTFVKAIGIILILVCLYGVVVSGSRGGFVGLISFYLCIFFMSKKKLTVGLVGVAGAMVMPLVVGQGYFKYMDTIWGLISGQDDLTSFGRFIGLQNGIEMMIKRPFLGVGPGCYPLARKAWFGWGMWAHNHYGQLMGELGVIGTIIWAKFVICYMRRALDFVKLAGQNSLIRAMALAVITATIVRLVVGMGSHSVYAFFWYMMAAVMAVLHRSIGAELDNKMQDQAAPDTIGSEEN